MNENLLAINASTILERANEATEKLKSNYDFLTPTEKMERHATLIGKASQLLKLVSSRIDNSERLSEKEQDDVRQIIDIIFNINLAFITMVSQDFELRNQDVRTAVGIIKRNSDKLRLTIREAHARFLRRDDVISKTSDTINALTKY
jgi:hypothetical protein